MKRSAYGLSLDVPPGWSSAILRRPADGDGAGAPGSGRAPGAEAPAPDAKLDLGMPGTPPGQGERTLPVVHVSTRAMPATRGDFGQGLIELLAPDDLFVALIEYGSDLADQGLFERQGMPRLAPSQFATNRMPREIPGRSASQHFFSVGGRAFCLYTVVGSHSRRMATVPRAASVVRTLRIDSAATMRARGVAV